MSKLIGIKKTNYYYKLKNLHLKIYMHLNMNILNH